MSDNRSEKRRSLPHVPHIPHHFVKHDSGTLAKLDVINVSILDSAKLPNKRRSPLGGILSILAVLSLLYFASKTFANTNFDPVVETEVAITYEERAVMELECQVETCYIFVKWGPEFFDPDTNSCADVTVSTNWYKRTIGAGAIVDPKSFGEKLEHDEYVEYQYPNPAVGGGGRRMEKDCDGKGTTWGPGLGPPPDGCGSGSGGGSSEGSGPSGNDGGTSSKPQSCFISKCVEFGKNEVIVIDNFAVMTNPKGGGVHVYWDTDVDRLGLAVPAHLSATGKVNKLFDGAHYMLRLRSEDKNTGARAVHWINEFSAHVNDQPVSKHCPSAEAAFSTAGKAEIYYKPTDITRTVIDNDVIYSVVGEIGGFLDIIIYAATGVMFVFWSLEKCYYARTHQQQRQTGGSGGGVEMRGSGGSIAMGEVVRRSGGEML